MSTLTAEQTPLSAQRVWYKRLERAEANRPPAPLAKRVLAKWHLLMCIESGCEAPRHCGDYTPGAVHKEREIRRVMSELGELHGIGPFPAPD